MKAFFSKAAELLGLKQRSPYVTASLNEANLRFGIFMGGVIVVLEIWMIIRQLQKYLIPGWEGGTVAPGFASFSSYNANFFLLLLVGLCLFFFCLKATTHPFSSRALFFQRVIPAGLLILLTSWFFIAHFVNPKTPYFEAYRDWTTTANTIKNVFLILMYLACFAFGVTVFSYAFYAHYRQNDSMAVEIAVLTIFAFICLVFGMKVSYGDYVSSNGNKMIMCFLTMTMYVGCLLIFRPLISFLMLFAIFFSFYQILGTLEEYRPFLDGDRVNYITFFISLTMVVLSIFYQRLGRANKDEQLEILATTDELTGLDNFSSFQSKARDLAAQGKIKDGQYVYLFANVNSFSLINEMHGFVEGDKALGKIGSILKETFQDALCCRESADHFVLLSPNYEIAQKMEEANRKVALLDEAVEPALHFGWYRCKEGEEPRRAVDKARHAASSGSSARGYFAAEYDEKMHRDYRLNQYVIHRLDEAVEKGHIQAYYQPVVDSKTGKLLSSEALCRWNDPEKGMISPGFFIPALEGAKIIYLLDIAMVRIVCNDVKKAIEAGESYVPISVNLSRLDFELDDIVEHIASIIDEYGIPKNAIHFEVTESALLDGDECLRKGVESLKQKGFEVWLDDFGAGYSSLNTLKSYSFDVLKLDMKFLAGFDKNEKARPIIESVVSMAKKLGIASLSEGVETKEQAEFLSSVGCGRLQGYLYGKPMPKSEFIAKVASGELKR